MRRSFVGLLGSLVLCAPSSNKPFRFCQLGDLHIGFGLDGWQNDTYRMVLAAQQVSTENFDSCIAVGDLTNDRANLGSSNTQTRLSSPGFTPQFKKRVHLLLGTHDISNVATLEQFTRDYNVGNHSSFSNKGYRFVLLDSISLSSRATGWRVRTMNAPICSHIDQGGRPVLQTMVRNRCKLRHQLSGAMGRLRRV
ncbi:hypothetical protein V8F44DRAFT_505633 [Aspergillus fumigatus]